MEGAIVVLKLLHIVSGIAMIAGGVGREFVRTQARRSNDMRTVQALIDVSGMFERFLAIPGSLVVFFAGITLAWLQGWPLLGVLQGASVNWLLVSLLLYLAFYPLVLFIFIPRGKRFEPILADATAQGRVTAELTAALNDRTVHRAHQIEYLLVAGLLFLMVAKPF
jgi:uncharacterized membrane protein